MDTSFVTLSAAGAALIPIVVALTQIVKTWIIDSRWAPVVAIVFGILASFVFPGLSIGATLLQGVLIGLAATGLFSSVKTTANS